MPSYRYSAMIYQAGLYNRRPDRCMAVRLLRVVQSLYLYCIVLRPMKAM